MTSNHLIICHPPLLLPSILSSIMVFSSETVLFISCLKYWSFSFNISTFMNIQDWFPLGFTGWISLQSKGLSRVFSNSTVQKHQFFGVQLSLYSQLSHPYRWIVKSLSHVWLFAIPWTVAYQAPLSMGFSRQWYWSGLPFPSPKDLPNPGIEPGSPAL